jgi:hypothetical protein
MTEPMTQLKEKKSSEYVILERVALASLLNRLLPLAAKGVVTEQGDIDAIEAAETLVTEDDNLEAWVLRDGAVAVEGGRNQAERAIDQYADASELTGDFKAVKVGEWAGGVRKKAVRKMESEPIT